MGLYFPRNMSEVWKELNLKLLQDQGAIVTDQQHIVHMPQTKSQDSFMAEPFDKLVSTKRVEFISSFHTNEVVLNIDEIPPLEIFYSSKHKVVMSRYKKRMKESYN